MRPTLLDRLDSTGSTRPPSFDQLYSTTLTRLARFDRLYSTNLLRPAPFDRLVGKWSAGGAPTHHPGSPPAAPTHLLTDQHTRSLDPLPLYQTFPTHLPPQNLHPYRVQEYIKYTTIMAPTSPPR